MPAYRPHQRPTTQIAGQRPTRKRPLLSRILPVALLTVTTLISGCASSSQLLHLEAELATLQDRQSQTDRILSQIQQSQQKLDEVATIIKDIQQRLIGLPIDGSADAAVIMGSADDQALAELHRNITTAHTRLSQTQEEMATLMARVTEVEQTQSRSEAVRQRAGRVLSERLQSLNRDRHTPTVVTPQPTPVVPPKPMPVVTPPITVATIPSTPPAVEEAHTGTPLMEGNVTAHEVMPGETLGDIAREYLGDPARWETIWRANNWLPDPHRIEPGMLLSIPTEDTTLPAVEEVVVVYHTVQAGETLGTIAVLHMGEKRQWKRLWEANNWLDDPNHLEPGLTLLVPVIPDHAKPGVPPPPAPPKVAAPATPPAPPATPTVNSGSAPPTSGSAGDQIHTVQAGETLGTIALDYLGDKIFWKVVWEANSWLSNPDQLQPGQRVTIPNLDAPPEPVWHTVTNGETLGTIAEHYLGSTQYWELLWRANPWLQNPDTIEPDQVLRVPPPPSHLVRDPNNHSALPSLLNT